VELNKFAAGLISAGTVFLAPFAQAQSNEDASTAHRLIVRSGVSVQLRGFTDQLEGEIRQNPAGLDEKLVSTLAEAAKQAFRPESLQQDMTARIAKKLTLADMKVALTWLEGEAGRRVTQAEELNSTTFDLQRFQVFTERLKLKPLASKRQKLIAELISVTDAVKASAVTQETLSLGVAMGMDALQPKERRAGEATLRGRLRMVMPPEKINAALAERLPMLHAYNYRDVTDADLQGYVRFLKSAGGKRYQDGMTAAFLEGLGRASVQVGELVGQRQRETAM
jgi:hypothetical protein